MERKGAKCYEQNCCFRLRVGELSLLSRGAATDSFAARGAYAPVYEFHGRCPWPQSFAATRLYRGGSPKFFWTALLAERPTVSFNLKRASSGCSSSRSDFARLMMKCRRPTWSDRRPFREDGPPRGSHRGFFHPSKS